MLRFIENLKIQTNKLDFYLYNYSLYAENISSVGALISPQKNLR